MDESTQRGAGEDREQGRTGEVEKRGGMELEGRGDRGEWDRG